MKDYKDYSFKIGDYHSEWDDLDYIAFTCKLEFGGSENVSAISFMRVLRDIVMHEYFDVFYESKMYKDLGFELSEMNTKSFIKSSGIDETVPARYDTEINAVHAENIIRDNIDRFREEIGAFLNLWFGFLCDNREKINDDEFINGNSYVNLDVEELGLSLSVITQAVAIRLAP